jgi:hypothetical protein
MASGGNQLRRLQPVSHMVGNLWLLWMASCTFWRHLTWYHTLLRPRDRELEEDAWRSTKSSGPRTVEQNDSSSPCSWVHGIPLYSPSRGSTDQHMVSHWVKQLGQEVHNTQGSKYLFIYAIRNDTWWRKLIFKCSFLDTLAQDVRIYDPCTNTCKHVTRTPHTSKGLSLCNLHLDSFISLS